MNIIGLLEGKIAAYLIGVLLAVLLILGIAWKVQTLKLKCDNARQAQRIAELEQTITGFQVASKFQEDKLAAAVARAEKEQSKSLGILRDLQGKPMPTTPEAARQWALDALERDRR